MKLFSVLCLALPLLSQEPAAFLENKTLARIESIDKGLDGVLGVTAIDLKTGKTFSYHGDLVTTQASLIKVPILAAAFQAIQAGVLQMERKYVLTAQDKAGGSGTLDAKLGKAPLELTFRELLILMIRDSDNTATNKVIALVTKERVNALMVQLKLPNTCLRRIMMDSASAKRDDENTSTPHEMARLIELIYNGKVVSPHACQEMIEMLKLVKGDFRAALPAAITPATKTGSVPGVHTEAGIVYLEGRPYVLSVMSSLLAGESNPIRDVVEVVNAHFVRLSQSNRYGHRVSDPLY